MISLASGLRICLACGMTDMRKGMTGLAMLVQQSLAEDPFSGAVYAFRGRRAGLIKLIWHDGVGRCGGQMHCIGELRTEQLDIVPVQLRVRVTRRPRYACRTCEAPGAGGRIRRSPTSTVTTARTCGQPNICPASKAFYRSTATTASSGWPAIGSISRSVWRSAGSTCDVRSSSSMRRRSRHARAGRHIIGGVVSARPITAPRENPPAAYRVQGRRDPPALSSHKQPVAVVTLTQELLAIALRIPEVTRWPSGLARHRMPSMIADEFHDASLRKAPKRPGMCKPFASSSGDC